MYYNSINMNKNQDSAITRPLLPIEQEILRADFRALGSYDSDDLEHLKSIWLLDGLHNNPSHKLLTLEAREEVKPIDSIRRAYRAGVLAGTLIIRHQLADIQEDPSILTMTEHEPMPIEWPRMKLARFALSSMFDTPRDVSEALRDKVEKSWLSHHNTFQPTAEEAENIKNDWLAIGMGDAIALNVTVHAHHHNTPQPLLAIKPLKPEPLLKVI